MTDVRPLKLGNDNSRSNKNIILSIEAIPTLKLQSRFYIQTLVLRHSKVW